MQGTSLNVKFMLAVCPSGLSYSVGNGLLPSSVYAQSNVFLCALSLYNITVIYVSMYYHALLLYCLCL